MAAYVIVDVDVHDTVAYDTYRQLAGPSVAAYGGRYLVRGGASATLEGDWAPNRLVLLEFPSRAQAQAWWDSPEYGQARAARQGAAKGSFVLVEGVES